MHPRVTLALKALIVVLLAMLLFIQIVMIPAVALGTAERNPEFGQLLIPGIIGGVVLLALVELALLCIFRLLALVRADRIFSPDAFRYVDVIIGALVATAVLLLASLVVIWGAQAGNPSVLVLGVLGITVSIGLALLVVVLRGLLNKALQLEQDLAEVV